MSSSDSITFEDIRNISDALNAYKTKEIDHALTSIRRVSTKFDDSKGKNKTNSDSGKTKTRPEEFKMHLQIIGNKFKSLLENVEIIENNSTTFYNYALLLFYMQQNLQCNNILEKLGDSFKKVDSYMFTKYKLLRIENNLIIQSYSEGIRIIDDELKHENQHQKSENDRINYLVFLFNFHLMLKQFKGCLEILEKLRHLQFLSIKLYEAHYHYCQYDVMNSFNCLKSADRITEKDMFYINNSIGCLHFILNKYTLAMYYFNRSLNLLEISAKKPKSHLAIASRLSMFGRSYEFIHNLGISMLFANKPIEAFDLLLEVVSAFPNNPRLWLRLAECCVKAYRLDEVQSEKKFHETHSVLGGIGNFKKLVFETPVKKSKRTIEEVAAMPTPSLDFGSLCIKSGLKELPSNKEISDRESLIKWYKEQKMDVRPGGCIRGLELLYLESSLLLNGAFIFLSLGNYVETAIHCERLLRQPLLSPLYRHHAFTYLAEAQTMMDINFTQNISNLNPLSIVSLSLTPIPLNEISPSVYSEKDGPKLLKNEANRNDALEEARANMGYNQACIHSLQRQFDNVQHCLGESIRRMPQFKKTSHYLYMRMHLELSRRNNKGLLDLLSDISPYFPFKHNIEA